MTSLLTYDESLFYLINVSWQNPFFDSLMPILRNKYAWFPAYLFLFSFLLINFRRNGLYLLLALALTIGVSDVTSSHFLKKMVKRVRPCKVYEQPKDLHLLVACGSGYSFPSSHAANHFAIAVFLCLSLGRLFRWIKIPLLLWALAISYAQVYVGVHYPVDVVAGALLGCLVGAWMHGATRFYFRKEAADFYQT